MNPSAGGLEPRIYDALRAIARRIMSTERADHTLQPTALVHEAFLRLSRQQNGVTDRFELQVCAARVMRQILVNHAHARAALRRGGGRPRAGQHELERLAVRHGAHDVEVLDLHEALEALESIDPRQHRVVELRYFAGLSSEEVAAGLGVSARTVQREWRMAQAWLRDRLGLAEQ